MDEKYTQSTQQIEYLREIITNAGRLIDEAAKWLGAGGGNLTNVGEARKLRGYAEALKAQCERLEAYELAKRPDLTKEAKPTASNKKSNRN